MRRLFRDGAIVSIPFEQGDVFRRIPAGETKPISASSQSLSNRAMSFDDWGRARYSCSYYVSIPFEQGDVFRPKLLREYPKYVKSQSLSNRAMSFDRNSKIIRLFFVSIPFEQGDVFRLMLRMKHMGASSSQSLSNRAMSFDSKLD